MSNVLDKVRKLKARRPQQGGGRMQGIFHQWKDGDNIIRLVGNFLEVKTHFIAPAPKRKERGLCRADAFQGDDKLSPVINCLDWDVQKEEAKSVKTCPICKLNAIAHAIVKEKPEDEKEKETFEKLRRDANARTNLKWNIVDRDDPHVVKVDDGSEEKVLGLKIATVGMEAWDDIEGIFEQMGYDITDTEDGIDIKVTKGHNGTRTTYSAQAVIDASTKPPTAKVTALTAEERELKEHDLKSLCGKQADAQKIIDGLHEDLRELLEISVEGDEDEAEGASEEGAKEEAAPETPKRTPAKKPAAEEAQESNEEESDAITNAIEEEDGDGLLDGTEKKD